jgi:hypothetical protein
MTIEMAGVIRRWLAPTGRTLPIRLAYFTTSKVPSDLGKVAAGNPVFGPGGEAELGARWRCRLASEVREMVV